LGAYFTSPPEPFILGNPSFSPSVSFYHDLHGYHGLLFSYDKYGQPVSGTRDEISLNVSRVFYNATAITNSSGFATVDLTAPKSANQTPGWLRVATVEQKTTNLLGVFLILDLADGKPVTDGSAIGVVIDHTDHSRADLLVFGVTDYNRPPRNFSVYYGTNVTNGQFGGQLSGSDLSKLILLGHLNWYYKLFSLASLPRNTGADILLLDQKGREIEGIGLPMSAQTPFPSQFEVDSFASHYFELGVAYAVPIGVFLAVILFIRARREESGPIAVSTTLDGSSLFARATLTGGLLASCGMLLVDTITYSSLGRFVYTPEFLAGFASFLAESAAFAGIFLVLAFAVRSYLGFLVVGVGVLMLYLVFWSFIAEFLFLLGRVIANRSASLSAYLETFIASLNPAQFYATSERVRAALGVFLESGYPIYFIEQAWFYIALVGAWLAVPFVVYLRLSRRMKPMSPNTAAW
jgi:hypothetical protein